MYFRLALAFVAALAGCQNDETLTAFGAGDHVWRLAEVNGAAFDGAATITFPEPRQIAGQAPCNSYAARQTAPYPWFEAGPIRATRRACAALETEGRFFEALASMSLVEVSGSVLVLSNDANETMVFHSVE